MRFLDANIFIYAYYRPKKELSRRERWMKQSAKEIVTKVSQGKEDVMMTVVHLSEMVNILKHGMPLDQLSKIVLGLFMLDNLKIIDVTRESYFAAAELGEDLKLEANDALSIDVMRLKGIREIYSFDEDFEKVEGITRLPAL